MNVRHTLQTAVAIAATVFSCTAALAAEQVGRVLLAAGDTFAVRDGKPVRLAFNSPIEFHDTLRTGAASSLQVRFVDDSLVSVRENSEFAIEDYQFGAKPEEQRSFFRLVKGGFRAVTGLIGRTNNANYRVRAENATIGIRGTDYAVRQCAGDCGANVKDGLYGTVLGLSHGTNRISVSNNAGESNFGINQHFYVASANTLPQPLLAPPSFVSIRPQGKASAAQQGGSGSGGEQATGSTGASGDSRPSSVVQTTVPTTTVPFTTQYTVTNTVTTTGTTTLVPGFTLGGLAIIPGSPHGDEGGGAFITSSMLTLGSNGIPTGVNIPGGCIGPNENCRSGFQATFGTPVAVGSATPPGATQAVFWGRWQNGSVTDENGVMSLGPQTNGDIATGMFMYGPLTPADVLAAKTGTLTLTSNSFGTPPVNNLGQVGSGSFPAISVNFSARTASIAASSVSFSGPSPQFWSIPAGSGPITIVPGSGGFFLIQGQGGSAQGFSCSGTGCNNANFFNAKAGGIFFGPVGDHAGVTLGAQGFVNNFTTPPAASFGAVRLYCASGC